MFKKLRTWWTTPVMHPMPAMLEDRLAPQEFKRDSHNVPPSSDYQVVDTLEVKVPQPKPLPIP